MTGKNLIEQGEKVICTYYIYRKNQLQNSWMEGKIFDSKKNGEVMGSTSM